MECSEKMWFPSRMGALGQTLRYYDFFFSPSKRTILRGMVSATKGHQTRLSACTTAFHTGR